MLKFKTTFKAMGAAALFSLGSLATTAPAVAQATSLNDILNRIRQDSSQLTAENQARLREFQSKRANELKLSELQTTLETEAGDFGELLGQFRQAAGETMPIISNSIANFQYPGRVEKLQEISQASSLPSRSDLDSLPRAILQEMIAQSEVTTMHASLK